MRLLCSRGLPSVFFDLLCGLFFVFPLHSRAGLCLMIGLTFLWPTPWFSLFFAMLYCYSCRNNLILLGLFWASRLFLLSVAWHGHCFAFIYGLLCPFGHPRPVCFLWVSSAHLLIPHSHGLFTNFIGLPWPNNFIFILGVHRPAINPLLSLFALPWAYSSLSSLFYLIHCPWDATYFFLDFFEPTCLFKTHLFISWACDLLFMPLGPNGFLLSVLSIPCCPYYWAFFLSAWALTNGPQQSSSREKDPCWLLLPSLNLLYSPFFT